MNSEPAAAAAASCDQRKPAPSCAAYQVTPLLLAPAELCKKCHIKAWSSLSLT